MSNAIRLLPLPALLTLLAGCSGSSDAPPPPAIYQVSATVSGLPAGTTVQVALGNGPAQAVTADGPLQLEQKLPDNALFEVRVAQQPEGAYCSVVHGSGRIQGDHASGVEVHCATDAAASLFDTARVHRFRMTVSVDDWNAFVLNTARSVYTQNAFGGYSWTLGSVSEIYRRARLDYLADDGTVLATLPNVGFRMRGNTSRMWPEDWTQNSQTGEWEGRPRRFHINLKFDEDFSDDESVYSCVDAALQPTPVNNVACMGYGADDIPPVPENSNRTFMGLESLALKFNKDDPTYVREALSHAVLNEEGVPAGRAAHASLELVIEPSARTSSLFGRPLPQTWQMGVFTMTEPVDKLLVTRLYGKNSYVFKVGGGDLTNPDAVDCVPYETAGHPYVDPDLCHIGVEQVDPVSRIEWLGAVAAGNQNIINGEVNIGFPATTVSQFAPYTPTYDLKTKKSDIANARIALNQFMALLNDPATTPADLAAVFDVPGFIRAQAVDIAVGAVDHYVRVANNYYLYQHPVSKKWIYIPYDYDFSFRDSHIASWPLNMPFRDVASTTVLDGENAWRSRRITGVNPRLFDLVFSDAANREQLRLDVARVMQRWFNWQGRLEPLMIHWLNRLEPAIRRTTAGEPTSGDTLYQRAAAFGDSYTYRSWVNAQNPLASQYAPNQEHSGIPSTDTVKRFVAQRVQVLGTPVSPP